ncbi:exodeoxyribonuclease V subunit beta [Wenyingzhuangia sp. 2_MG-2023]|uniref:UvrD-helicase domain-containing protein n=1 Tax=Wenyingzhuangia sp. 2_MG-2023 TaxID=3062639 RepID=UPI0026E32883|nr:UvrD-helicase domain-containing protein [Wenyingzhuangia sp. 2_MG-2023]MDO6736487.1 UvrD-helicase domain-containing protein [Wenyingzhuangia sp. 2_MG-2023]
MISESFFKVYNASAGSGKTYTLVKEYLKVALSNGEFEFQKILAITFTNKAAAEMKQRVLNTLKDASRKKENPIIIDIATEIGLSIEEIQRKSQKVLENILHNYASFHIITIDSFTHKLIRTFSLDLGLPLDFDVEMDVDPLLKETIDLLVSKIGEDKELTKVLVDYALHQVNEDKSWNINDSLVDVARLLLNEENEVEVSKLINTSLSDFQALEKRLRKYVKDTEEAFYKVGHEALSLIQEHNIEQSTFAYGDLPKYFEKLKSTWFLKEELPASNRLVKNMEQGVLYSKSVPKDVKKRADRDAIDSIKEELITYYQFSQQICDAHFGSYFLVKKILKSIVPLTVLSYIHKEFSNLKEENNFRLNAEFNRVISKQIKNEPVPFIYERLGEKFQYFFIDEMQDTSELQWQNLIPLIHNALSQNKGGLMLVGDAKQSIYRWRGGKASQFVELSDENAENEFFINKEVVTLGTNYRSYSNVINFNNDFFSYLSGFLKEPAYQEIYASEKHQKTNSKEGGYVYVDVHERDDDFDTYTYYSEKIHQQILEIETNGFDKGDICILTRNKKDGIAIADYLVSQKIEVISPDSLLLKNNSVIQFLIYLLRWIENPEDKEVLMEVLHFLFQHFDIQIDQHEFYQNSLACKDVALFTDYLQIDFSESEFFSLSLYDGLEYLIRVFRLEKVMDVFGQTFLDVVLQFQLKESGGLQAFLEFWDRKKEKLKVEIASNKNAVQIMTIHKSKGLEFPVVIFPFDLNTENISRESIWYQTDNKSLFGNFTSFRINASSKLDLYGEQGGVYLKKVNEEIQLDNINLLYVALTRAEEQLYVFSDFKNSKSDDLKNYSDYFKQFIADKGEDLIYEIGTPTRLSEYKRHEDHFVLDNYFSVNKEDNKIHVVENLQSDEDPRIFGNIIHKAFEKIITFEDVALAIAYINQQGLSEELNQKAVKTITNIINHPLLKKYYQKEINVYNERSFLTEKGDVLILDRLVFIENKAVIIDYKTGHFNNSHESQIRSYSTLIQNLGLKVLHAFLVYCNDEINVNLVTI